MKASDIPSLSALVQDTNYQITKETGLPSRLRIVTIYSVSLSILAAKQFIGRPRQLISSSKEFFSQAVRWVTRNPIQSVSLAIATSTILPEAMAQDSCITPSNSWHGACMMNRTVFVLQNDAALRQMYADACGALEIDWCTNNIYPDITPLSTQVVGDFTNAVVGIDHVVNARCLVTPTAWLAANISGDNICYSNLPASSLTSSPTPGLSSFQATARSSNSTAGLSSTLPLSSAPNPSSTTFPSGDINSSSQKPSNLTSNSSASISSLVESNSLTRQASPSITRSNVYSSSPSSSTYQNNVTFAPTIVIGTSEPIYTITGIQFGTYLIEQDNGLNTLIISLNGNYYPEDGEEVTLFTFAADFGGFDTIIIDGTTEQCYRFKELQQTADAGALQEYGGLFEVGTCETAGAKSERKLFTGIFVFIK